MNRVHALLLVLLFAWLLPARTHAQQTSPTSLAVTLEGLRSVNHQGSFKAAAYLPDGSLVLLFDAGDGLRLLKTDSHAGTLLAEAHQGAAGDIGVSLITDAQGDIYVAGTAWSGTLTGSSGAAFPSLADSSENSFVAGFDRNLQPLFLTFLGAGRTAVSALAVSADAVFVTGTTYSSTFPITSQAVQGGPTEQGSAFVQRFSHDGTNLVYSTLLGPSDGSTTPSGLAVTTSDQVYVVGTTSSPGFPTLHALQAFPADPVSGFISALRPDGSGWVFSSLIAGTGLSSIGLDQTDGSLWITGNLSFQAFPIANALGPVADLAYQSLLRLSADGQNLTDSVLLQPGTASYVTPAGDGTAWVSGDLTVPLDDHLRTIGPGQSYLLHLSRADQIDQILRFGGTVVNNPRYASLSATVAAPALNSQDGTITLPGTLQARTDPSLRSSQVFALELNPNSSTLLTGSPSDLLPPQCDSSHACAGSAGLLAQVTPSPQAALKLSWGELPLFTLRNSSGSAATGLRLASSAGSINSNCADTLQPWAQCTGLLPAADAQRFSAQASNAPALAVALPAATGTSSGLTMDVTELDLGLMTAADAPITRTVLLTNLGSSLETFASAPQNLLNTAPYLVHESSSSCAGTAAAHSLQPGGTCSVTLSLVPGSALQTAAPVSLTWSFGSKLLPITGHLQAQPLSVSTTDLRFGRQPDGALAQLPRFLFLTNASGQAFTHVPANLASNSPFSVADDCPDLLQPHSICALEVFYSPGAAPSFDTATLQLDQGIAVVLTGEALGTSAAAPGAPDPALLVSPASVQFTSPVAVSGISSEVQRVELRNTGAASIHVSASVLGDFQLEGPCAQDLAPGGVCTLLLKFTPTQPDQRIGVLTLSAGDNQITVPLAGTGTALIPGDAGDLDLGQTPVGEPIVTWLQLAGTFPSVSAMVQGQGVSVALQADWGGTHGTVPDSAFQSRASAPCSNCWLGLRFAPQSIGTVQGALQLGTTQDGHSEAKVLHGTGVGASGLVLSPSTADFGSLPIGSRSSNLTFTLAHLLSGAAAAKITSVTVDGDFALVPSTGVTDCGTLLDPTASCRLQLTFSPTKLRDRQGKLTVTTDKGTATAALSGTGTLSSGLAASPTLLLLPASGERGTVTFLNTSPVTLKLGPPNLSNTSFSAVSDCTSLSPGQSCSATVSPVAGGLATSAFLTVTSSFLDHNGQQQTSTLSVPVKGSQDSSGLGVSIFPTDAAYAPTDVNQLGQVRQFTLTNTGSVSESVDLAASRSFPLATPSNCHVLAVGTSCTVTVAFVPQIAGSQQGSLLATVTSADGQMHVQAAAYLRGFGSSTATLTVSRGSDPGYPVPLGEVRSGETAQQALVLSNTGSSALTIRRLITSPPFRATGTCTAPLAAGATCEVTISYSPQYSLPADQLQTPRQDAGTLEIESDAGTAAATVYLTGTAIPVAGSSQTDRLPTFALSQTALTFANTLAGSSSSAQGLTLTNTGSVPLVVDGLLTPPDFHTSTDCATLQPGSGCSIQVTFTPGSSASPLTLASLGIVSNAATSLESITLLGSSFASPWQVAPEALDFGKIALEDSQQLPLVVTNQTVLPLALDQVSVSGDYTVVPAPGACPTDGSPIPAGQSCTLNVVFTPSLQGVREGVLTVNPGEQNAVSVSLTGTGVAGTLGVTPTSLNFGTLLLHTSSTVRVTLSNTGDAPLKGLGSTLSGTATAEFAVASECPATLASGASCTTEITFTPASSGDRAATLQFRSSDPHSPLLLPLLGTGSELPGFTLSMAPGSPASAAISSGEQAQFALLLTAKGGFTGELTLQCTALEAAPNAVCAPSATTASLQGDTAGMSVRVSTLSGFSSAGFSRWMLLWTFPMAYAGVRRRTLHRLRWLCLAVAGLGVLTASIGCGGTSGNVRNAYTPPGTYRYQVTATSVAQPALSSEVVLQVVIR